MAFTLAGSIITQSGTDTDLSGLASIAGVTAMTAGSGVDLIRFVNVNNLRLVVTGTLTMNAGNPEMLVFGESAPDLTLTINTGATFNLGRRTTLNSTTRSEQRIGGIYFSKRYSQHFSGQGIDNYGTFNWYGDIVGRTCPIRTNTGGAWVIRDGAWICRETTAMNVQSLFFHNTGTVDIDGFRIEGSASFTRVNSGVITNFLNVVPYQADSTNQNENSTSPFDIFGFNPQGCAIDFGWWLGVAQTRGIRSYDSPRGTNLYCGDADSAVAAVGWVEMWRRVKAKAVNPANAAISGAVMYVRDTNNGNRGAASSVTGTGMAAGTTVTARNTGYLATDGLTLGADRVYIQSTAADGTTPQFNMLIGACAAQVAIGRPGYDVGACRVDRRGKTDVATSRANTDAFDFHLWSYGHQYTKISDSSMAGSGIAAPQAAMLLDASVTLTQAQAAALTSIATLDNLYDAAKNWKCQATQANLEYPTIDTPLAAASGTVLDLGSRNLIINGTAASAFAINTGTNTITIKASALAAGTKFTSLKTTGSVTFANGGTITGNYTDASGTRVTIKTADNLPLTTRLLIGGVDQGEQVEQAARNIYVTSASVVRIYAHAYGYQPKIINVTGNTASDYVISLAAETNVDTSLDTTTRDTIISAFATGIDAQTRIYLSVSADLRQYTPAQVLNALHRFMVVGGGAVAAAALAQNDVSGFALIRGGFILRTPGFYGKVAESVTADTDMGIYVPLYIMIDPAVYVLDPAFTPVKKNAAGVVLGVALWTQQEADVPTWVANQASLQVLNRGVQKASLLIPHSEGL